MRILKSITDTIPKKIIYTDIIDSFYQEFNDDYLNFYKIQSLNRLEKENTLLFLDVINEIKNLQNSGKVDELAYIKINCNIFLK